MKEPPLARLRKGHEEKEEHGEMMTDYSSSTLDNFLSSPSPLSSRLYSSMKLPAACLNERDGCDEAELIARAKRCEEILRLSKEAALAEAERVRIANIKPLVWAKPTFDISSSTSDTAAAANETTQGEEKLGKRKERQEEPTNDTTTMQHYSSSYRDRLFTKPRRTSTPEEVQAIRTADETEEEETEEEEMKCDRAASFSS